MKIAHNIRILHDTMGELVNETFVNYEQFSIFLKLIDGCLAHKEHFDFFNGSDYLVHIPYRVLVESVILTKMDDLGSIEMAKSKIEALVTRS
jgi:hypothetical protein